MSETPYIPTGFSAITPYLHLQEAQAFIEFVQAAFGAEVTMNNVQDGRIMHAELRIAGCMLELSEAREDWPALPAAFHFYVPDCDAVHARALAAGAEELQPPMDQPYGERSSALKDRWGVRWYVATVTNMAIRTGAEPAE